MSVPLPVRVLVCMLYTPVAIAVPQVLNFANLETHRDPCVHMYF